MNVNAIRRDLLHAVIERLRRAGLSDFADELAALVSMVDRAEVAKTAEQIEALIGENDVELMLDRLEDGEGNHE